MNETELERLMKSYGESMGKGPAMPHPNKIRYLSRPALFKAGMFVTAVAVGWVLISPRDAMASTLKRIGTAIKNVRTMRTRFSILMPSGRWRNFTTTSYKDRMWRYDVQKSDALHVTLIKQNNLELTNYDLLDHATLDTPQVEAGEMADMDALSYAKQLADSGQTNINRKVSILPHNDVGGRPVYTLVLDRAEDRYHAEVLVDKATDLPISSEITVFYSGAHGGLFKLRQEFEFNIPFGPKVFSFEQGKAVVDVRTSMADLEPKWSRTLGSVGDSEVRDACVTPDGTIWLAMTVTGFKEKPILPTRLVAGSAMTYVRLYDLTNSSGHPNAGRAKMFGKDVAIVGFAPLEVGAPIPIRAVVYFSKRPAATPVVNTPEDPSEIGTAKALDLSLRREQASWPSYFAALDLDRIGLEMSQIIWRKRSEVLESEGRLLDAAHAYERTAKERALFAKYIGYEQLLQAASCYERLGMKAEADRDGAEAAVLKASRER